MYRLKSHSGVDLCVAQTSEGGVAEIRVAPCEPTEAVLHWGAIAGAGKGWRQPAPEAWPAGSEPFDRKAVRTSLAGHREDDPIVIRLDERKGFSAIEFVLHHPKSNAWDDNQGRNYHLDLLPSRFNKSAIQVARELVGPNGTAGELLTPLADEGVLAVVTAKGKAGGARIALVTDRPGQLLLHWGIALDRHRRWSAPPPSIWPADTKLVSEAAARTPFVVDEGFQSLVLEVSDCSDLLGVSFVLFDEAEERWFRQRGGDFFLRLSETSAGSLPAAHATVAETIIEREMGSGSWTLMHRFNLAHDLMQGLAEGDRDGAALIFVWMRYSALRQLDWQRNYNTQPRELSHAEDRFTRLLASRYATDEASRRAVRWVLPTLGRGGDGQRVRDGILQIMHRHRVKEVTGHFLEEWHQKLHNNTTPDDVVICQAYLAFLRSEGDRRAFYDTLEAGGVTRARLRSFERPIRTDPDFAPHLRDGLIHDFEAFLRILKSVHDGVDLESALRVAESSLEPELRADAWWVWQNRKSDDILALARTITRVRERLSGLLQIDGKETRDRLSLDVALEDFFRVALERNAQAIGDHRALARMVPLVLRNLSLSWGRDDEVAYCIRQWERLAEAERSDGLWALRSHAALDRTARALASDIDQMYELLQPKAEFLGRAFEAEPWTIQLFSEEVVRGRLEFVAGMLLRRFDAALRRIAGMPACQVVSRGLGEARGRVLVTSELRSLQGESFDESVVVVADHVAGDEELPPQVSAVLTRDAVDLVSHVAVRARNTGLVMVTVHDPAQYDGFRALRDASVGLRVTASGDVVRDDSVRGPRTENQVPRKPHTQVVVAPLSSFAVPLDDVDATLGGGKSNQLRQLRKKLDASIRVPRSMVIPFSVFPHVVGHAVNAAVAKRYLRSVRDAAEGQVRSASKRARDEVLALAPPDGLMKALKQVGTRCGLRWPADDDEVWRCIKQVWASKWNERAVLNRRTTGMPDDELHMAVLVQEVAEADYSYVLHTVHPNARDTDLGYGEVVLGLGEVLVGNHPGRPLGFSWSKRTGQVRLSSMPSKRISLVGGGLMFRSDSSGEDLEGLAGAGLYDSVQLPAPRENIVDYASEPLVWDDAFRTEVLESLGRIGQSLERALGGPQDVEGTYRQGDYVVVQSRPQAGA